MRRTNRRRSLVCSAILLGALLPVAAAPGVTRVCLATEESGPMAEPDRMRRAFELIGGLIGSATGEAAEGMRCWARRAETPAPAVAESARLVDALMEILGPALVVERGEQVILRACVPASSGSRSVYEYLRALLGPAMGEAAGTARCYTRRPGSLAPPAADQDILAAKLREAAGTRWMFERVIPSIASFQGAEPEAERVHRDAIAGLGLRDSLAPDGRGFDGSRAAASAALVPAVRTVGGVGEAGLPTFAGPKGNQGIFPAETLSVEGPGEAGLPTPAPGFRSGLRSRGVPTPPVLNAALIDKEAQAAGLDPKVLRAVVAVKSRFNLNNFMRVSLGAAAEVGMKGADLDDPAVSLRAGARYLAKLKKRLGGNLHAALAAYEVGLGRVLDAGGNVPNDARARRFLELYELEFRKGPRKPPVKPVQPSGLLGVLGAALREPASRRLAGRVTKDPWAPYLPAVKALSAEHGVDPQLAEALLRTENGWANPRVTNRESGAMGLGQLVPKTAAWLGVRDPLNPEQSLDGSIRYQRYLLDRFGGDRVLAVAAYHGGEGNIGKVGGGIPAEMPKTTNYVEKVFTQYRQVGGESVAFRRYFQPAKAGYFTPGP